MITTIKTANNGGCGECACHCHSDEAEIPPGHLATCKFADDNYVPPGFEEDARQAVGQMQTIINESERYNPSGVS